MHWRLTRNWTSVRISVPSGATPSFSWNWIHFPMSTALLNTDPDVPNDEKYPLKNNQLLALCLHLVNALEIPVTSYWGASFLTSRRFPLSM